MVLSKIHLSQYIGIIIYTHTCTYIYNRDTETSLVIAYKHGNNKTGELDFIRIGNHSCKIAANCLPVC